MGQALLEIVLRAALRLHTLRLDRRAVTAIEYALMAGLIMVVIVVGVTHLGQATHDEFNSVASEM